MNSIRNTRCTLKFLAWYFHKKRYFGNHSNAQWSLSYFHQCVSKSWNSMRRPRPWRSFVRPVCQVPQKRDRRSFYFAHGSLLSLFGCESQCYGMSWCVPARSCCRESNARSRTWNVGIHQGPKTWHTTNKPVTFLFLGFMFVGGNLPTSHFRMPFLIPMALIVPIINKTITVKNNLYFDFDSFRVFYGTKLVYFNLICYKLKWVFRSRALCERIL